VAGAGGTLPHQVSPRSQNKGVVVKRISMAAIALLVLAVGAVWAPGIAGAAPQDATTDCLPGDTSAYPPETPAVNIDLNLKLDFGHYDPGGAGLADVSGGIPGEVYCGINYSAPIVLPAQNASAAGKLTWGGLAVPADFQLNAMHHIDVYHLKTKVGNFDFCVTKTGDIGPASLCKPTSVTTPPGGTTGGTTGGSTGATTAGSTGGTAVAGSGGSLARTGLDHLIDVMRIALIALTLGAAALYGRRRVRAGRTA
jgi:hypothetical protein